MKAMRINTTDDFSSALNNKVALINFNAPWCSPCLSQNPIIDKLAGEFKDKVYIGKMDIETNQYLAERYAIQSIPTLSVFKDGEEIQRLVGLQSEKTLASLLQQALEY